MPEIIIKKITTLYVHFSVPHLPGYDLIITKKVTNEDGFNFEWRKKYC